MQGTLYLGSRRPKAYDKDSDPSKPVLSETQPGELKCRIKFRTSKDSTLQQTLSELQRAWNYLDHGEKPAWVSGTNETLVTIVAEMFGGIDVRECEPAAGDE